MLKLARATAKLADLLSELAVPEAPYVKASDDAGNEVELTQDYLDKFFPHAWPE